jgi:cytochrome c peroxidase
MATFASVTISQAADFVIDVPLGDAAPKIPADNPMSQAKVELGKKLFYDPSFSFNGKVACATCHIPEHGFADITATGFTSAGGQLPRNTPSAVNAAINQFQFWDGRAESLEAQVAEVARPAGDTSININKAVKKCATNKEYADLFEKAFAGEATSQRFCQAIAAFERTLLAGNTKFDRFLFKGEEAALTQAEKRGYEIFVGKGNCSACHSIDKAGSNAIFIDNKFHNTGVGAYGTRMKDAGRYNVTGEESDFGSFKTPSLRNVALTSPYMHDGSFPTLESVVEFYNKGGNANKYLDPLIKPLHLNSCEKHDLIEFLKTLSDDNLAKTYLPPKVLQDRINKVLKE